MSRRSVAAADLLERPGALLTSSHLAELGPNRRAIDAVWRALPVVILPGYRRPMKDPRQDYRRLIAESTYADNRVLQVSPTQRAELPDDAERFWVAGFDHARPLLRCRRQRLSARRRTQADRGSAPARTRPVARDVAAARRQTIEVEARGVGGDWQVVPVDVLDDRD